jgi:hypothetical protein
MSTYSTNLKLTLIGTGEQAGTWGTTTNSNLGTLIEQAIVGYETQAVTDGSSATVLTIPNATSSTGRNYVIEFTGTLTAARTVEVPAVDKPYIFFNNTTGGYAVTVKVSGQTGVSIANGAKLICYVNSTDVIKVLSTVNDFLSYVAPSTNGNILTSNGSAWVSAAPVQTGVTGLSFGSTGLTPASTTTGSITVAGTLAVANGGTGQTTATAAFNAISPITTKGDLIVGSATNTAARVAIGPANYVLTSDGLTVGWQPTGGLSGPVTSVASSFTGGVISVSGSPITSAGTLAFTVAGTSGGVPYFSSSSTWASSAALTQYAVVVGGGAGAAPAPLASLGTSTTVLHGNASGAPTFGAVSLTADVSGTLPAANGGTGLTAPGSNGNVLTSNGTAWTSAAPAASGVSAGKAIALSMIFGF